MSVISPPSAAPHDDSSQPTQVVPPPRVATGAAMRRYWIVVLLCVLLLTAAGVAIGLRRTPTYSARAEDVVQALAPSVAQLPGAVQAAQDLASNESRLIESVAVTGPLARRLQMSPAAIEDGISATSIPDTTVIRIDAESGSARTAVALANGAAEELATYVNTAVKSDTAAQQALARYKAASAATFRAIQAKRLAQNAGKGAPPGAALATSAAADAAALRKQALSSQYQSLIESQGSSPNVQTFVLARHATSDRQSNAQIYGFAGLVLGLLIGAAFASLLATRRARHTLA